MQLMKNVMFNVIYDCGNLNQIVVTVNWLPGFTGVLDSWLFPPFLCVLELLALGFGSDGWIFFSSSRVCTTLEGFSFNST